MYKLLIVDDEPWVLRSLQDSVKWNRFGFSLIGTATDGNEALQVMETIRPDLVVTDIRMPVMDGLALIEESKVRWPNIQFIILSGHAEFDYARRAMANNVSGYCLKPVQEDEMEVVLLKVKLELDEKAARRMEWMLSIDETDDIDQIMEACHVAGVGWDTQKGMRVVCGPCGFGIPFDVKNDLSLVPESLLPALLTMSEADIISNLTRNINDTYNSFSVKYNTAECSIGISRNIGDPRFLSRAVTEAQSARRQWFMTERQGVFLYSPGSHSHLRESFERLEASVRLQDIADIQGAMKELEKVLITGEFELRQVLYCWTRLSDLLDYKEYCELEYDPETENELLEIYPNIHAMLSVFTELLVKKCTLCEETADRSGKEMVSDILTYAESHAIERISLKDIAEEFHFSSSYLCRIFKKETGATLTDFLMRFRLDKAAEMLGSTERSIAFIAEQCGYKDYFYFSRLFKRTFGMTPTQYRTGAKIS